MLPLALLLLTLAGSFLLYDGSVFPSTFKRLLRRKRLTSSQATSVAFPKFTDKELRFALLTLIELNANSTRNIELLTANTTRNIDVLTAQMDQFFRYKSIRDKDLELRQAITLFHFLSGSIDENGVLNEVLDLPRIIMNPKKVPAVEWDAIYLVGSPSSRNKTLYLLESKQTMVDDHIYNKVPMKLNTTLAKIVELSKKEKEKVKLSQASRKGKRQHNTRPHPNDELQAVAMDIGQIVVVMGGANVGNEIKRKVLDAGHIAVFPSGFSLDYVDYAVEEPPQPKPVSVPYP